MSKEIKKTFDAEIEKILKNLNISSKSRVFKKSIKLNSLLTKNSAEISFDFLAAQKAYYFNLTGYSDEFSEYIEKIKPPYNSNTLDGFEHHFNMSTLQEKSHSHSNQVGKIYLTSNHLEFNYQLDNLSKALAGFYIPWLIEFLDFKVELIYKILQRPDFYSYPIPMVVYILKKQGVKLSDLNLEISKKIIKNKEFDNNLMMPYL